VFERHNFLQQNNRNNPARVEQEQPRISARSEQKTQRVFGPSVAVDRSENLEPCKKCGIACILYQVSKLKLDKTATQCYIHF